MTNCDWEIEEYPDHKYLGDWADAAVWEGNDLVSGVAAIRDHERGMDRARLIAAAGSAAHELDDEYDPVDILEALPELVKTLEEAIETARHTSPMGNDYIGDMKSYIVEELDDALQKALRDDE